MRESGESDCDFKITSILRVECDITYLLYDYVTQHVDPNSIKCEADAPSFKMIHK